MNKEDFSDSENQVLYQVTNEMKRYLSGPYETRLE